jgi:3-carboxy-cis,cis-muconate cycloisomerase
LSVSPFDHPFLSGLVGDHEIGACFSAEADIAEMLAFERALAVAEAKEGLIPADAGEAIEAALAVFDPDLERLRLGAARDGVVVDLWANFWRHGRNQTAQKMDIRTSFGSASSEIVRAMMNARAGAAH